MQVRLLVVLGGLRDLLLEVLQVPLERRDLSFYTSIYLFIANYIDLLIPYKLNYINT